MNRRRGSSRSPARSTTTRSERSPPTESTSSSTRGWTLPQYLLQAVYELSTVKPHEPDDARFDDAERQVYHVGYFTALRYALLVMELAHYRWKLRRRHRRAGGEATRAGAGGAE